MPDGLELEVTGVAAVLARLEEVGKKVEDGAVAGVLEEARATAARAAELAPVQTGRLRGSVVVSGPELGPDGLVEVAVAFTAPYAAEVHERTGEFHAQGQPKFLEKAGNESAASAAARIADKAKVE